MPSSRTVSRACPSVAVRPTSVWPPGRVYFSAFDSRFVSSWAGRSRSPSTGTGGRAARRPACGPRGRTGPGCRRTPRARRTARRRIAHQLQPPRHRACAVQQVVAHPRRGGQLPFQDGQRRMAVRHVEGQQLGGRGGRREGVAQLVRERRDEPVLGPLLLPQSAARRVQLVIGPAQLLVHLADLPCPYEQVDLHALGARLRLGDGPLLLPPGPPQPHEFGDVLHAVDDVPHLPVVAEHRRVDRAPVPLGEGALLARRDVVALQRHRVRTTARHHRLRRTAQMGDAVGRRVVRVVGEHVEDGSADDAPLRAGRREVGAVDLDDREVRAEDEQRGQSRVEQAPEVRDIGPGRTSAAEAVTQGSSR